MAGTGQLDPFTAEHPSPPAQLVHGLPAIEVFKPAGTSGEGAEKATLPIGEHDTGHGLKLPGRSDSTLGGSNERCGRWPLYGVDPDTYDDSDAVARTAPEFVERTCIQPEAE